jgi:hypothetical protein
MDTIFTLKDIKDDEAEKINLDELYEKKQFYDLQTLNIYNKLLNRIHNKIKLISRQHIDNQHCWFVVPEVMIGIPKYDHGACIAYIIDKLNTNGFVVKYTHPNLLFISWKHWIPKYVRDEIKKKTGIIYDGYGNKIDDSTTEKQNNSYNQDPNMLILPKSILKTEENNDKNNKNFKDINSYKPTGLIYNKDMFKRIEDKFSK